MYCNYKQYSKNYPQYFKCKEIEEMTKIYRPSENLTNSFDNGVIYAGMCDTGYNKVVTGDINIPDVEKNPSALIEVVGSGAPNDAIVNVALLSFGKINPNATEPEDAYIVKDYSILINAGFESFANSIPKVDLSKCKFEVFADDTQLTRFNVVIYFDNNALPEIGIYNFLVTTVYNEKVYNSIVSVVKAEG